MSLSEDYVSISVGFVAILISVFGEKFYWAKGRWGIGSLAPTWAGKLLFSVVGFCFLSMGFYNLFCS